MANFGCINFRALAALELNLTDKEGVVAFLCVLWRQSLGRRKPAMGSRNSFLVARGRGAILSDLAACSTMDPAQLACPHLRRPNRSGRALPSCRGTRRT